jgi:hypothetical protein
MGVVVMSKNKTDVKRVYAAIIRQAQDDWKQACKNDNRSMKNEIRRFFRSDWGMHILDILEIDIKIINDKYQILKNEPILALDSIGLT